MGHYTVASCLLYLLVLHIPPPCNSSAGMWTARARHVHLARYTVRSLWADRFLVLGACYCELLVQTSMQVLFLKRTNMSVLRPQCPTPLKMKRQSRQDTKQKLTTTVSRMRSKASHCRTHEFTAQTAQDDLSCLLGTCWFQKLPFLRGPLWPCLTGTAHAAREYRLLC